MEDKQKQTEEFGSEQQQQGSGSLLAAARKHQQRTIEEIAAELNLSVSQIKTIELDQTDGLPEPTYVRGYIRGYAKLLDLNPDEVLSNYLNPNWQQTSNLNDIPKGIGSTGQDSDSGFFTPTKTILLLMLVGSFGFLWYSGMLSDLIGSNGSSTVNESTDQGNSAATNQTNELATLNNSVAVQNAVNNQLTASGETLQVAADASDQASTDDAGNSAGLGDSASAAINELVLSFSETSWVDIRDVDDARLAYKSYAAGENLQVSSESIMSVFIGNAAGVSVEYNGMPFDITEYREGVYAKFEVGQ